MAKWRRVWKDTNRRDGKPGPWKRVWKRVIPVRPRYGARGTIGPAVRFTWSEAACTDGTEVPSSLRGVAAKQGRALNKLRKRIAKHYGLKFNEVTIDVTSWFRSQHYNDVVLKAASKSQHKLARATDIVVRIHPPGQKSIKISPRKVAEIAESVPEFRDGGIGWYDSRHGDFTHVDHRPDGPARWINNG